MSDAYYPRYTGDYQRDTAHLKLIQHGAYALLLDHYYATGKPLPTEKEALYRLCRAFTKDEQRAVDSIIAQFFQHRADGWHNKRADAEIEKRGKFLSERSESGRRGAARRWHGTANGPAIAEPMAEPLAEPMAEGMATTTTSISITNTNPNTTSKPDSCASHTPGPVPSAPGVCERILVSWNENCGSLPKASKLTKDRRSKILARVKADLKFAENFEAAVRKARNTPFLCGTGDRGWKATFDWLIANEKNVVRVLEGVYENVKGGGNGKPSVNENIRTTLEAYRATQPK